MIDRTPGRTPDERPENGQVETRDWHPDEQPTDDGALNDHFTEDEADAIQLYIDQLKVLLGPAQWDVFLSLSSSDPGTNASVHPVYCRRVVPIAVNRDWWTYTPNVQRNTLVHELLHVVHNAQTEVIRTSPTSVWMWRTFERETELMVDHLAGILDQHTPWPTTPVEVAEMREGAGTRGEPTEKGGGMSDSAPRARKDGRPLYFDHPANAMDEIEYLQKVEILEGATRFRRSREDDIEAWMFDD